MHRMSAGFALIEILITMIIVVAMIPVTIVCLSPLMNALTFNEEVQDQIALSQIRRILLLSYDIECERTRLTFAYQEKPLTLSIKNDHLVLSPGTQIFLSKIDGAVFEEKDECIYIVYTRMNRQYEKVLCEQS